jgi:predicted transcriptional regulator
MPRGLQPAYAPVGALDKAPGDARTHGPGLYYLEFTVNGKRRGYSGQARHMGQRLAQHRTCAAMMGILPAAVSVYIAPNLPDAADRRKREWTLHDTMFNNYKGVLTNQRRELELALLGEEHEQSCACRRCRQGSFSEEQELELALELMAVQSEAELEQFLGKMFKGVWKGIKKVATPLGGILKGIARKALPFVGGALGSFIPIPGVGTALGRALGGALSKALEMELAAMPGVDRELEAARRFVRIAGSAAQAAGEGDGSPQAVRRAVLEALRSHVPRFGQP